MLLRIAGRRRWKGGHVASWPPTSTANHSWRLLIFAAAVLFIVVACNVALNAAWWGVGAGGVDPSHELPVDPDIVTGTLDNGLTYYIMYNDSPGTTAELRLVVDAGSLLEEVDQSGVAHFLEHMMFNGTRAVPARTS